MKIERVRVFGFEPAFRGMRNPQDSWDKGDSRFYQPSVNYYSNVDWRTVVAPEFPEIGPADLHLASTLIRRGSEHRKFLRQIVVWMDITIPRYVWQELDTYKVATVRNSCSTMNKLGARDLEHSDFELPIQELTLERVNALGRLLREAKEEHQGVREARRQLKNELPEGFLQMATYTMSYETALSALLQRENHRLPEWRLASEGSITAFLMSLPYMQDFYKAATFKRDALRAATNLLQDLITRVATLQGMVMLDDLDAVMARLKDAG